MKARRVALVGTPNAGKTALFNALTRSHQRVANYSGVTVESAEADFLLPGGQKAVLVDLPGAYSLRPYTDDEGVLARELEGRNFDAMILVVDSTQPERAIRFLMEVLDATPVPAVVALNMVDLAAERGFEFDLDQFAGLLGVPVVATVATRKVGLWELQESVERVISGPPRPTGVFLGPPAAELQGAEASLRILNFYKKADELQKRIVLKKGRPDTRSQKWDRLVLHPFFGPMILMGVLAAIFQLMFNLAAYPMDAIDALFSVLQDQVRSLAIPDFWKGLLADGLLAGAGGTLVFLPQIVILYALILFLEDVGFMARAVFMLDTIMGKVGLHGRSFLPLLSSYACNVPGILSTRAIESRSDRIVTILMIPLTTCSARIPVYTLLISAFIPNAPVLGGVRLQGMVMLGLYVTGLVSAFLAGAIFKRGLFPGKRPPLLIELPSYKMPSLRSILRGVTYRARLFLRRVGTVIVGVSLLIWLLLGFPRAMNGEAPPVEQSFAATIGKAIEPLVRPIGFDWRIGMALIPTFAAREVMVSTLSTVYSVEEGGGDVSHSEKLSERIQREWGFPTGLSLLVWFIFAPMCVSTFAAARRELQSRSHLFLMGGYLFGLAYLAAWMAFRFAGGMAQ
jgi:ferrous iron transport protein B